MSQKFFATKKKEERRKKKKRNKTNASSPMRKWVEAKSRRVGGVTIRRQAQIGARALDGKYSRG